MRRYHHGRLLRNAAAWPESLAGSGSYRHTRAVARSEAVEEAVAADVGRAMGTSFDARRFIPYVVMHEFEAKAMLPRQ